MIFNWLRIFLVIFFAVNFTAMAQDAPTQNFIWGDFNGDGKKEKAWISSNMKEQKSEEDFGECNGECACILHFSDKKIRPILINQCIGAELLQNEGDLDEDGADEISLIPSWWTSCWMAFRVYTYKSGQWRNIINPRSVHCTQIEDKVDFVLKIEGAPKTIETQESVMDEEAGIIVKRKKVKLP